MKSTEERLRSYEPLWENWYYTGELLGQGGMSGVFEIMSEATGEKEFSALKVVTVERIKDGKVQIPANALNEINILRSLSDCPNIVHYYDSTNREIRDENGNLAGMDILVRMEKLKSLTEGSKLDEKQVIKLATDMCNAISSAAERGIIHRDIKPQNIFMDSKNNYKLGDFGVAKIVSEASVTYTKDIGTLAYAAPEICGETGEGGYDATSDIYSLGLVLYVFLNNGDMPFADSCESLREAVFKRVRGGVFPPPKQGGKKLKSIVMRACDFDPKRRYKTANEMLEDLKILADGGKKYIIDPFATLNANEDGEEIAILAEIVSSSAKPAVKEKAAKGGLKISVGGAGKAAPKKVEKKVEKFPVHPERDKKIENTGSKLKMSFGKVEKSADIKEAPKAAEAKTEKLSDSKGASKLKISINMTEPKTSKASDEAKKIDELATREAKAKAAEKPKEDKGLFKAPEL